MKPKEKSKFEADIKEAASKLGGYRQVFAWGAVQLFDERGELAAKDTVEIKNLSRVKGDVYSFIIEMEKDKSKQVKFFK
jgi:hypothetical protein